MYILINIEQDFQLLVFPPQGFQWCSSCWLARTGDFQTTDVIVPHNDQHGENHVGENKKNNMDLRWRVPSDGIRKVHQNLRGYNTLMLTAPFCKWFWSGFWVPKHRASQGIWSTRDKSSFQIVLSIGIKHPSIVGVFFLLYDPF